MLVLSWVVFTAFSLGCASAKDMTALYGTPSHPLEPLLTSQYYMPRLSRRRRLWSVQPDTDRSCRSRSSSSAQPDWGNDRCHSCCGIRARSYHRRCRVRNVRLAMAVQYEVSITILLSNKLFTDAVSIPFGLVAVLAITNFWPHEDVAHLLSWDAFASIDFIGSATLLCSSGLLVFAIQQAGSQTFAWNSPGIISALTISAVSWIAFIAWEVYLETRRHRRVEPIFPIRLMLQRVYAAGLL